MTVPRSTDYDRLGELIDQFAALPPEEQRRQVEEANRYLSSPEGQREFGCLLGTQAKTGDAAPEQGLH